MPSALKPLDHEALLRRAFDPSLILRPPSGYSRHGETCYQACPVADNPQRTWAALNFGGGSGLGAFSRLSQLLVLTLPTKRPELKILPIELPLARVPIGVVTLKNCTLSPVAQLFIEMPALTKKKRQLHVRREPAQC